MGSEAVILRKKRPSDVAPPNVINTIDVKFRKGYQKLEEERNDNEMQDSKASHSTR